MICPSCGSEHDATHRQQCFRCHVKGISFGFKGGAIPGRSGWNMTQGDYMREHFGTTDDRELGRKGIERA